MASEMHDTAEAAATETAMARRWRVLKREVLDTLRFAAIVFPIAFLVRTFIAQPFHIPSTSMAPTLEVGDFLIVSKYPFGYSKHSFPFSFGPWEERVASSLPVQGDIVVFKLPCLAATVGSGCNPLSEAQVRRGEQYDWGDRIRNRDYIKRVVGLPGDEIRVEGGRLNINGAPTEVTPAGFRSYLDADGREIDAAAYRERLPNGVEHLIYEVSDRGPLDNYGPITVPDGQVFLMGDHRDNSTDSRVFGPIPIARLVGRAEFLAFSVKPPLWQVWRWPFSLRGDRFAKSIE